MGITLITITGPSGAGKDTAARILSQLTGVPVLVSYTTRPIRKGEMDGREHHFVSKCSGRKDQMLAYTVYGGYEYWTEVSQVKGRAIYVIDEDGIRGLLNRFPTICIVSIYIDANKQVRMKRGVTPERISRDDTREPLPRDFYRFHIYNNKSEACLREALQAVADTINTKKV